MGSRRLILILSNILLIVFLSACMLLSGGTPTAAPASTAAAPTSTEPPAPTVASTASTSGSAASGACANAYYPAPSGATWTYASTGSTSVGDYTYTRMVTAVSSDSFTTSDHFSTGVDASFKWTCQKGNLAALDAGSNSFLMSTSKVTMTSDSVTATGYNIPASFDAGKTWSEKVTVKGTVTSGGKKVGTSQVVSDLNCSAAGADTITVPAGKFDTVKATCTKDVTVSTIVQKTSTPLGANKETITYWYAKGVGFVQSIATGGTDNETIVLTQYKIP